ncbi:MAG TPA: hypothetical protein VKN63_06265 [Afifellaceae bacterium]|nr:hypothetical protein [Afifellaceae bacterium]
MTKYRKQAGFAALGLAMAMGVSAGHALEGVMMANAEMHVGPAETFPVVGHAAADAEVKINGCKQAPNWCVVRSGGRVGWVPVEKLQITGISRKRNKFDNVIVVINVDEQLGARDFRRSRGRTFRGAGAAAVPVIVEQERAAGGNGRRVYRSGVGSSGVVPNSVPDFTTVIQVD